MSYILEALKKAQAERQLGSAPTIHAPAVHAVPAAAAGRTPLLIGAGAGALVLAAAAAFMWQQGAATVPVQQHAAATQPVAPPVPQSVAVPAASAGLKITPAPQVALLSDPDPAPAKKAVPDRSPAPPPTAPVSQPAPAAPPMHDVEAPVRASVPVPAPVPAAPAAADQTYRAVSDLPEAVRRELPKVVFGGYIYSPNPGESLLLVDKVLRREGDEVAPGLVLEKLLPGAALMNYKGFRYRVPY